MSHYIFKGRLCGYICAECPEPLANLEVRLYRVEKRDDVAALAVANPKETFALLDDEQVKGKESRLLAKAETDAEGNFTFELGKNYAGEAFEVDVYCGSVPRQKIGKNPPKPRQFTITTLQPRYRETENGFIAVWNYCLPYRFWCAVLAWFDVWTICGRVLDCKTQAPIAGLKVMAFDVDWLADDALGLAATTDAAGKFIITYSSVDFRQGTWIDVELIGGPDLYFKIETPTGTAMLTEPSSRGRAPDRENSGPCFCVDLCIEKSEPTVVDPIPLFTHVGRYRVDPTYLDFTTDGLTTAGNLAFTGPIPLIGLLPNGNAADALEYRFRVAEYDAVGAVLGPVSDVDQTMIEATVIGQLEYFDWNPLLMVFVLKVANYWVNNASAPLTTIHRNGLPDITLRLNQQVDPGGWIKVPRQKNLAANEEGLFVGGFVSMASLKTTELTNEFFDIAVPAPAHAAGESVPVGKRSRMHRFKLIFEARKVVGRASVSFNEREKIVMSNTHYKQHHHPSWAGFVDTKPAVVLVDVAELAIPGAGCNKVSNHVHALFTAYHPFLGSVNVYFEGPTLTPLPSGISPAIVAGEAVSLAGGHDFNFTAQPSCAYILWLSVSLNLTHGEGPIPSHLQDHVAFCKG